MKELVSAIMPKCKFLCRWGFIPFILYLGFKRGAEEGMPELTIMSLFVA